MRSYTLDEIDKIAQTHIKLLQKSLDVQTVIDLIIEEYDSFINIYKGSPHLLICRTKIDEEVRLRLNFEALCIFAFVSREPAADFFTVRQWFKKTLNVELLTIYYSALSRALHTFCTGLGSGLTNGYFSILEWLANLEGRVVEKNI
jgi:hypothetical protein